METLSFTEIGHLCLSHLAPRNSESKHYYSAKCMVGLITMYLKISIIDDAREITAFEHILKKFGHPGF